MAEPNGTDPTTQEDVTPTGYTPEQQADINRIIADRVAREKRAAAALKAEKDALQAQVDSLNSKVEDLTRTAPTTPPTSGKQKDEHELNELTGKVNQLSELVRNKDSEIERAKRLAQENAAAAEKARKDIIEVRKQTAIANAASKANFVNVEVVEAITSKNIKFDEEKNQFVVLNEQGEERIGSDMRPLTLNDYYKEVASNMPYLVKAGFVPGANSSSQRNDVSQDGKVSITDIFGPKSNGAKATKLMKDNPAEYHRLRVVAESQGLVGPSRRSS